MSSRPDRHPGREAPPGRTGPVVIHAGWTRRGWSDAAGDRLEADPLAGLVWRRAGGDHEVLAAPGEVTAVGWDGESVLLTVRGGAQVVLPLAAWAPDAGAGALDRAGFRRLLEALGRGDAWTFDVSRSRPAAGARTVVPDGAGTSPASPGLSRAGLSRAGLSRAGLSRAGLSRAGLARAGALGVAGYAGLLVLVGVVALATGSRLPWLVPLWGSVALAISLGLFVVSAVGLLLARRRALAPVAGERVAGLRPPVQLATGATGELVIVDALSRELRLAGPADGGIGTAVALLRPATGGASVYAVRLHGHDRAGQPEPHPVVELPAAWFTDPAAATGALRGWLERAGVGWREVRVPVGAPAAQTAASIASLVVAELWSTPLAGWNLQYAAGVVLAVAALAAVLGPGWWTVAAVVVGVRLAIAGVRWRDRHRWLAP